MLKPRLCKTILLILFFVYWFVLFPLLFVYLRPVLVENGWFGWVSGFWIPSMFWGIALIIFIILLLILWCVVCCIRKKSEQVIEDRRVSNANLDSFKIHSETNKNIKDRVQMNETIMEPRKSDPDAYRDIQDIFRHRNSFKPKPIATPPTINENLCSAHDNSVLQDMTIRNGRLNSCDRCSQLISDDEMVNIFLNKKLNNDTDDTNVKFEVVGKSVQQGKRFTIQENIASKDDDNGSVNIQLRNSETSSISVPVTPGSRMKSEVFIFIDEDSLISDVNGSDNVFK